nr:hypothetical protein Itr_chr08CG07690 [Ipomoea trifida]
MGPQRMVQVGQRKRVEMGLSRVGHGSGMGVSSDKDFGCGFGSVVITLGLQRLLKQVENTRVTHILGRGIRALTFSRIYVMFTAGGQRGSRNLQTSSLTS